MRLASPHGLAESTLATGRLLGRRKRFFADVALDDGRTIVAHCPNTGRLLGCLDPGAPVVVHDRASARRALAWTWVLVRAATSWVAVESGWAVAGVREAWMAGLLPELAGPTGVHAEVPYGRDHRSRIDLLLSDGPRPTPRAGHHVGPPGSPSPPNPPLIWVEVKATTLVERVGVRRVAAFPDAVTERGTKQLEDLVGCVRAGARAAVVFAVMRGDASAFTVADKIDPRYGKALRDAVRVGVEVYALAASIRVHRRAGDPSAVVMRFVRRLPVEL